MIDEITKTTLYMIIVVTQLILGAFIGYKAIKTRMRILWILAGSAVSQAIVALNIGLDLRANPYYYYIIILITYLTAIAFIQQAFYKGRESKGIKLQFLIVLLVVIIFFIADTYMAVIDPGPPAAAYVYPDFTPHTRVWINFIWAFVPNIWVAQALLREFIKLRRASIEPWIKFRYLIGGFSHLSWSTLGISFIFLIYLKDAIMFNYWILFSIYIFTVGSFIAWVMPEALKKFFNRNFTLLEGIELTEAEIMKMAGGA